MKTVLFLLIIFIASVMLWIRLSPIDRDRWHVDPAETEDEGRPGLRLIGLDAPRFPGDPETVLAAFADIALSEPRVRVLDGSLDEGMITFVARTRWMGFPDLVTVKAVAEGTSTKLAIASRSRFGGNDWGVNAARLDRWLKELEQALGG